MRVESLSQKGVRNPSWQRADFRKFSTKIIAIYNLVQRALLTKDIRGIEGAKKLFNLSSAQLMHVYEQVRAGNNQDPLIRSLMDRTPIANGKPLVK